MQVTGGGLELGMAEQHLDGAQIDAVIQQMGGEGVAHYMGAKKLGYTRLLAQLLADLPNAGQVHGRPRLVSRKEPVLGFRQRQ